MAGSENVDKSVNQVLPGPLNNARPFESTVYNFGLSANAFQALKNSLKITIDRSMSPAEVKALLLSQLARVNASGAATGSAATKTRSQPFVFSLQNLGKEFSGPAKFYNNLDQINNQRWVLPVPPSDFSVSVPNSQSVITTISGFTYTHAGNIELDEISFDGFFPYVDTVQYSATTKTHPSYIPNYIDLNNGGAFAYHSPREWVENLVTAMRANQPLIFSVYTSNLPGDGAVVRSDGDGVVIEPVAMSVSSFSWEMGTGVGGSRRDVKYSITLKRWRRQQICITNYVNQYNTPVPPTNSTGGGGGSGSSGHHPHYRKYTVRDGDYLIKIAQRLLGDGRRWREIYDLNKKVIGNNPNLIYAGQVLRIPRK